MAGKPFPSLLAVIAFLSITGQWYGVTSQECPIDWESFGESCYHFQFHPVKDFEDAKVACQGYAAALVSVESISEHGFISNWLDQADVQRNQWYTSGEESTFNPGEFWWTGSGLSISPLDTHWISDKAKQLKGKAIIYQFTGFSYGWTRSRSFNKLPYICEISRVEAHRIFQLRRTFLYGTDIADVSEVEKGPRFALQPHRLIIIGDSTNDYIECEATGNPRPTYRWRKLVGSEFKAVPADSRYTFTNGRFSMLNPREKTEGGTYQCIAENKLGRIVSSSGQISFGYLRQFSNVGRNKVNAIEFQGASIECGQPASKPGVKFQWYKDFTANFLRPNMQAYQFISQNGRLYFSEVTNEDKGKYYCIVTLADYSDSARTSKQVMLSGTSLAIPLAIERRPALDWGPQINNDFIAVFPKSPLRGDRIRMECFAYGTGPLVYSWTRLDQYMPSRVRYEDHNRVLVIPDALLEDSGQYECRVSRRSTASDQKIINLKIAAVPYFIKPLGDAHVDRNTRFTWRCEARSEPDSTYTWLKDGQILRSVQGDTEIHMNVLTFSSLDPVRHNGMYQCQATNIYGSSYSSGQLRVLVFSPSFKLNPLPARTTGAIQGNVTLECRPEASPFPSIQWSKNGGDLGLSPGIQSGRFLLDVSGDLRIRGLQTGDSGTYKCTATNAEGSASSSTYLQTLGGTTIYKRPGPTEVLVNSTAFFFCQASHAANLDLVYNWYFNGQRLDLKDEPFFAMGTGNNVGGLYVRNAQLLHNGMFKCVARTPLDNSMAEAKLRVIGPPSEMAGVYVDRLSITSYSMRLKWTTTSDNGRPILSFIIEAQNNYYDEWDIVAKEIRMSETYMQGEDKSTFIVDGLKPNVGYKFRVLGVNEVGISVPSQASDEYHTPGAPPNAVPERVGGGGGSVGLLTMTWEPLAPIDAHGSQIGYIVYWRRPGALKWNKNIVKGNEGKLVRLVGQQNFFLEYEVKVQAYNEYGNGPNSSVEVIFSAEDMPIGVLAGFDTDVVNGTAITLMWDPLPETRQSIRGRVEGYWINYWIEPSLNDMDYDTEVVMHYKPVYGQVGETTLIGLEPGTYYMFTIQVFNSAGLGPISEDEFDETDGVAPLRYPMEVSIHSHGPGSVFVKFRGISTTMDEDPLRGYMLRYWGAGDRIENAIDVDLGMELSGVIDGLQRNKMYELRTLGYSDGGYGKQSPSVLFTLGGQVVLDTATTDLMAGAPVLRKQPIFIAVLFLLAIFMSRMS